MNTKWNKIFFLGLFLFFLFSEIRFASAASNGEWRGSPSSYISSLKFTVSNNHVSNLEVKIIGSGTCPPATVISAENITIINNTFIHSQSELGKHMEIGGTFGSNLTSEGIWFYFYYDTCTVQISGKWNATNVTFDGPSISVFPSRFNALNVIDFFDSPADRPFGLTFDGTYLWNANSVSDRIYKLDTSGNVIESFASPGSNPSGLTFDGTYLWNADSSSNRIYKLDTSGNVIESFASPGSCPSGLAFDGTYLWNADSVSDRIYKLDTSGNVIESFASPGSSPSGLAFDGTYLWNADPFTGEIYRLDTSGNIIKSFDRFGPAPMGLTFDGTYLWNTDIYTHRIYKCTVPPISVKVGSSTSQLFKISNLGNQDLFLDTLLITGEDASEYRIKNDTCSSQTISVSQHCTFKVILSPKSSGEKNASLEISSNDPNAPSLDVSLTFSVSDTQPPVANQAIPWIPLLLLDN
jgi:DNA-binding beta-propeller fold protein YncE